MRILVVEDEQKLAQALQEGLEADHYAVTVANAGEDGPAPTIICSQRRLPKKPAIDCNCTS